MGKPLMIALVQPLTASFQATRTPARPQSRRAAVQATYDPMFAPMMLEGFPAVPIYEFGAGTPLNALSSPQLWAQGSPDWSAMMVPLVGAVATGALAAGFELVRLQQNEDSVIEDLCVMVDVPSQPGLIDKDWWLCPDAKVGDGDCQEVFFEGDYGVACAY